MDKWIITGMGMLLLNLQIRVWQVNKYFSRERPSLSPGSRYHPTIDTGCECSSNSSCNISLSPDCNCNSFLPNSSDQGTIYSLSKLPIMKLNYGGSISPYSSIHFKLGPMVCSGKSTYYPSESAQAERKALKDWILQIDRVSFKCMRCLLSHKFWLSVDNVAA